jgi:hypothetical protein
MSRKNRRYTSRGSSSAQQGKVHHSHPRLSSAYETDKAQQRGQKPTSLQQAPTPKQIKPLSHPGRILSLHNVPSAATEADVRNLLAKIPLVEYKRSDDIETNKPSEIAFLLFPMLKDARRAFVALDGKELLGQEVRANFVNGVRFESRESQPGDEHLAADRTSVM